MIQDEKTGQFTKASHLEKPSYFMKVVKVAIALLVLVAAWYLFWGVVSMAKATQEVDNCDHNCPVVEWTYKYCPSNDSAYTSNNSSKPCSREFGHGYGKYTKYADKVTGDTFKVAYEKSQDPNKCHRPSDNDLNEEYDMSNSERSAFKADNGEWKNSIPVAPEGYYLDGDKCYPNKPKDVCPNIDGVQESLPVGYHYGEGENEGFCLEDEVTPSPTPTPTPTPSSTPTKGDEPLAPQHAEAYKAPEFVCNITKQVANPLVWRKGDQAIVQWQATEGNKANVYYKLVKSSSWEHSVIDTENDGYVVINGLGKRDWTFAVQQECGPLSPSIIDGDTKGWTLFRI